MREGRGVCRPIMFFFFQRWTQVMGKLIYGMALYILSSFHDGVKVSKKIMALLNRRGR